MHTHTRPPPLSFHPKSSVASSTPRSPKALSPRRAQLDPELVGGDSPSAAAATAKRRSQITHAGGGGPTVGSAAEQEVLLQRRSGRASPERTAGSVVMGATAVEEGATKQLKEASSFWLVRA